jgi:lipopolysaccharide/colanic/teichoic acid biosynthesis glycosyltransferase
MAMVALVTKLTEGPVLYRQTRIGEDGRHFTIYKFCTMKCDAERDGVAFARENDPRATRIGCFLRRTHLDELPQLWNVLKGEMSIVGPRPERPEFIELIEEAVPFWSRRLLVKPGITGWAQVRCGYASDCEAMETKLSYDLWYLRHRSLLVDLALCVMTFFAVARSRTGVRVTSPSVAGLALGRLAAPAPRRLARAARPGSPGKRYHASANRKMGAHVTARRS